MLKTKRNVFQTGHFTDTCRTSVGIRYVSDTGDTIDEACPGFIGSLFPFIIANNKIQLNDANMVTNDL